MASGLVPSRHLLTEVDKVVFAIPTTSIEVDSTTTKRPSGGPCVAK